MPLPIKDENRSETSGFLHIGSIFAGQGTGVRLLCKRKTAVSTGLRKISTLHTILS